jgi:hypothetical protein
METTKKLTKNDMARVIVFALCNMAELPPADHFKVVRCAREKERVLVPQFDLAQKVLAQRGKTYEL